MRHTKAMSELQAASLLKAGRPFMVHSAADRQKVLNGARFIGCKIVTRAIEGTDSFNVVFINSKQHEHINRRTNSGNRNADS